MARGVYRRRWRYYRARLSLFAVPTANEGTVYTGDREASPALLTADREASPATITGDREASPSLVTGNRRV